MSEIQSPLPESPLCKLGVLCVHGIGSQKQGETLDSWGGGIVKWLQDWLAARGGEVAIQRAALRENQLHDGTPAHTRLQLRQAAKTGSKSSEWIIAESWWAENFYSPSFGTLAAWMVTSGSWIIISHISNLLLSQVRQIRNKFSRAVHEQRAPGWIRWPVYVVGTVLGIASIPFAALLAFLLVSFVQLIVVILVIFSLIPIPSLRSALKDLLVTLQGVLGDSFVFTSNPLARTSVLNQVQDDLRWLEQRCESVVVLAHSQGAAVAYHALAGYRSDKVRRLITFGSGLLKLSELQATSKFRGLMSLMKYAVLLIPLYVICAPSFWHAFREELANLAWVPWHMHVPDLAHFAPVFLMYLPILILFAFVDSVLRSDEYRDKLKTQLADLSFQHFKWLDIFATHDPVPGGSMFEEQRLPRFETRRVSNRMSMLADHTSYWENIDEFVAVVVCELNAVAGFGLFQRNDYRRLVHTLRSRRSRVRCLWWCHLIVFLSILIPIFLKWSRVMEFGRVQITPHLPKAALEKWMSWMNATGVQDLTEHGWVTPGLILQNFAYATLGVGVVAVLAGFWYFLMYRVWRSWNRSAIADSLGSGPEGIYILRPLLIVLMAGVTVYAAARCTWLGGYEKAWQDLVTFPHRALTVAGAIFRWGGYVDFVFRVGIWVVIIVGVLVAVVRAWLWPESNKKSSSAKNAN